MDTTTEKTNNGVGYTRDILGSPVKREFEHMTLGYMGSESAYSSDGVDSRCALLTERGILGYSRQLGQIDEDEDPLDSAVLEILSRTSQRGRNGYKHLRQVSKLLQQREINMDHRRTKHSNGPYEGKRAYNNWLNTTDAVVARGAMMDKFVTGKLNQFQFSMPQWNEYKKWYLTSALYNNKERIHTDRRLTMIPRQTQGLGIVMTYACEAASAIATAYTCYIMSRTGRNMVNAAQAGIKGFGAEAVWESIKTNVYEICCACVIASHVYQGTMTVNMALLALAGLGIWIKAKGVVRDTILNYFSTLTPVNSTTRGTQGADPTTLAQAMISIAGVFALGLNSGQTDLKSIVNTVKGFGSILLTLKTAEQVLVHVITMLPDILQSILVTRVPAFGLYIKMTTDKDFKKFIEKTNELRNKQSVEIMYNSHNLAVFLNNHKYLQKFLDDENMVRQGYYTILRDIVEWYDTLYAKAFEHGLLPGRRHLPFVIWLAGDPGVGKSSLVMKLAESLVKTMLQDNATKTDLSSYIYSFNTANKYFDGYNNQPVFIMNDYLQFTDQSEEQWLIKFADTIDCPLEVASVDNVETGVKGEVRFTSRIIIITSNTTHLEASHNIISTQAFNRRRDVLIDMTWKNQRKRNLFEYPQKYFIDGEGRKRLLMDYSWARLQRLDPTQTQNVNLYPPYETLDDMIGAINVEFLSFRDRSGSIQLEHATRIRHAQVMDAISNAFNSVDKFVESLWDTVNQALDYEILGFKFRYIAPLLVSGSAAYLMYKAWVPTVIEKLTNSLSGDSGTLKHHQPTRPLQRTTMGLAKNTEELINRVARNMVQITTQTQAGDKLLVQTMSAVSLGGSLLLTPKHLWSRGPYGVAEGSTVTITRGTAEHKFEFKKEMLLELNRDLACLNIMGVMPLFRTLDNALLDASTEIKTSGEDGILVMRRDVQDSMSTFSIPVEAYIVDAPYVDGYGTTYQGSCIWQYNHRLMQGDCGSVLLIQKNGSWKIAGIHVAGDSFSGNSEVVTREVWDTANRHFTTKTTQGFCTNVEFEEEYFDAESDFSEGFYFMGKAKRAPYQQTQTEIVRSPLYAVLQEPLTAPSVLRPSDPRMEIPHSPIITSVSKYGQPILPFNSSLMDRAFVIVREMYSPIRQYDLEVFSHHDAVNATYTPNIEKLDLRTSAGYPWTIQQKRKSDLMRNDNGTITILPELEGVLNRCEKALSANSMFPYTLTTTLKDERVGLEKVRIGKTRTFMNFPVEYTILMRRYFDDFIDKETRHAMEIGTTVGVNIYSTQWSTLYTDLKRFEHVTDGDFKAFDGTIRPEFFQMYGRLVNSFYKDEHAAKRMLLINGCCFAPIFVLDKVYMKLQGNPSGSRLTTTFNSFVNRMYVIMSMLAALPERLHTPDWILSNCKIFAHGDDHLIGFSEELSQYWNALKLQKFMLLHNIDYTSSTKGAPLVKWKDLEDCYYLKSYFVYDHESGMYRAGLDKNVIQEMVSWQRDNSILSTEMICNTALRYAYFWGWEYFEEIREKLYQAIKLRHLNIKLIDYLSLDIEYRHGGQLKFEY